MKRKALLSVALIFCCITGGCNASSIATGPKKEVKNYEEKIFTSDSPISLSLKGDSSNIEIYSWEKNQVKFEITKRIRGNGADEVLMKRLDDFDVKIEKIEKNLNYTARYKKGIKNAADTSIDLKLYLPRKIERIICKLDIGTIKIIDDLKCSLDMDVEMVNVEIKRFKGNIKFKADMGNLKIENGKLYNNSDVNINFGNIGIKTELEEGGIYSLETQTGNIELQFPEQSQIDIVSTGAIDENEFSPGNYPTKLKIGSGMGKITIRKYKK